MSQQSGDGQNNSSNLPLKENKPRRIYNVEDDEPKDVALRIFKCIRSENEPVEKNPVTTEVVPPNETDTTDSSSDSEHETEESSETSSSSSDSSSDDMSRPSVARNRYKKRRKRFLRMANDIFHISSMKEFCNAAKIQNEKELIKKYENLLVSIECACSDWAKKKHEARLMKKQKRKNEFEGTGVNFDSDVSTPYVSGYDEYCTILSESAIAKLSPISRAMYLHQDVNNDHDIFDWSLSN